MSIQEALGKGFEQIETNSIDYAAKREALLSRPVTKKTAPKTAKRNVEFIGSGPVRATPETKLEKALADLDNEIFILDCQHIASYRDPRMKELKELRNAILEQIEIEKRELSKNIKFYDDFEEDVAAFEVKLEAAKKQADNSIAKCRKVREELEALAAQ